MKNSGLIGDNKLALKYNDEKNSSNSFLNHIEQDHWNDIQANSMENESVWKKMAILAFIGLIIVSIYAMFITNQDKHKTIVYREDALGNLQVMGIATSTLKVDNRIVAHQLKYFIEALREVPIDVNLKKRNIDLVHKMIDPKIKSIVDQLLIDQYSKVKDQNGFIEVQINNIKPLEGGRSWEIRWTEKSSGSDKEMGAETSWDATVTFKQLTTSDAATQLVNPAGLYITYINPTQDIIEKGH